MSKGGPPIPPHFACPISLQLMLDPVTLCTGVTYDRPSIERWLASAAPPAKSLSSGSGTSVSSANGLTPFCPSTMQPLWDTALTPNLTLRRLIHSWCAANNINLIALPSSLPQLPLNPLTLLDTLAANELVKSVERTANCSHNQSGDVEVALDALRKLRYSAEENPANRDRLASAGALKTLSQIMSYHSFSASTAVFDEALTTLALLLPSATSSTSSYTGSATTTNTSTAAAAGTTTNTNGSSLSEDELSDLCSLTSVASLQRLANCLHEGGMRVRASVAFVLDCLVNGKQAAMTATAMSTNVLLISGLIGLLRRKSLMRRSVHLSALNVLIAVLCSHGRKRGRLITIESGVIEALLDLLPEAQTRSLCERILAVLELVISCPEGREAAADNDLLIPALVHKICGVSSTATMCAIGALLKMCRRSPCYEKRCREAVQAGAIPKVFLLLQVGSRSTMDRANELLRQLRRHSDCSSSADRFT